VINILVLSNEFVFAVIFAAVSEAWSGRLVLLVNARITMKKTGNNKSINGEMLNMFFIIICLVETNRMI